MDVRKEEEMYRFLYIEGNAYNSAQIAEFLGMKEKYFYNKFLPSFKNDIKEQIGKEYVSKTKRHKYIYTRFKYDAYQLNENVLMAFYRQNKALRPVEIERITDIFAALAKKSMTKDELVAHFNKQYGIVDPNAFSRSFDRTIPELEQLGVIRKTKTRKPFKYSLNHDLLTELTMDELVDVTHFVHFVSNTSVFSVPGYFLFDILNQYLKWSKCKRDVDIFSYKYINFSRILDEYKCLQLLQAFQEGRYVTLRYYIKNSRQRAHSKVMEKKKPPQKTYIPVTILFDHQYGRWYFIGKTNEDFQVMKMEGLSEIELGERIEGNHSLIDDWKKENTHSWLLSCEPEEVVRLKFYFDPDLNTNNFIKERVELQGQWGKIIDERPGYFIFEIIVRGTNEIKPWIRSFGSSVEVLEPLFLREELYQEWLQMVKEYDHV